MKRKFFISLFMFCCFFGFAQVSVDPNNSFYKDAKIWETKGIIGWLPQIRPYSIETVKSILLEVKENGDESDIKKADFYYRKYFSKGWNLGFTIGDNLKTSSENKTSNMIYAEPEIFGDLAMFNLLGFGYHFGVLAQNKNVSESSILPAFETSRFDTHNDPATIGPVITNIDVAANLTVGKANVYGLIGVNRFAYGPFLNDSVLINGGQFHSGNFGFVFEGEKFGYSQVFSVLSRSSDNGKGPYLPEKYLGFHTLRFSPVKQFAVSIFEGSILTDRFDPTYFIPVPYMVAQCLYSADDNLIMGLTFEGRPVNGLGLSLSGVIDDISINEFAKGNFDARFKFALMAGVNYTPEVSFIDSISANYTIVAPYTYAHSDPGEWSDWDEDPNITNPIDEYNKDNFTTRNNSLGTKLPPNSDRLFVELNFTPVDRLKLNFFTSFARHANIAETFTDEEAQAYIKANKAEGEGNPQYSTDGSIWTSNLTYPSRQLNQFMQQDHKMYVFQCALNAEYELERAKWGTIIFNAGYMFEYIYNKGVDSHLYTDKYDTPQEAKDAWVKNLHNEFNNYFSCSVKYCY